jgi:thymidylate synthase (FAD)
MEIRLVSISQPTIEGVETPEDLIAYTARVSNPANQSNFKTAPKLIKYLIENKHWSPLEMVDVTFEITTTRDISRQLLRHRSFSFQEYSQRYAKADSFSEYRECRLQDTKNRQQSIPTSNTELISWWYKTQDDVLDIVQHAYKTAIDLGIAKEQARALLPEGLTKTTLYMKGSLRSWIHWYQLRSENGTQKEHAQIAEKVGHELAKLFPNVWSAINGTT